MIVFDRDDWLELCKDVKLYARWGCRGTHFGYWMGIRVVHFWESSIYDDSYSEF
jgi:hypothetical protein